MDERQEEPLVTFRISGTAAQAINLDDASIWPPGIWNITWRRRGRGEQAEIRCTARAARSILADLEDRGETGMTWDQPSHWGQACRKAVAAVRQTIIDTGEDGLQRAREERP